MRAGEWVVAPKGLPNFVYRDTLFVVVLLVLMSSKMMRMCINTSELILWFYFILKNFTLFIFINSKHVANTLAIYRKYKSFHL